jgi:hypothetical protein
MAAKYGAGMKIRTKGGTRFGGKYQNGVNKEHDK